MLQLTITMEDISLPQGTGDDPNAIAQAFNVPVDRVIGVTLFREENGFVGIIKSANRRLNFSTLFKELNCSWSAFPSPDDLRELGTIDLKNPFALASNPCVRIVVDAWTLQQRPKELIIPLGNDHALRTCVTDLMIGAAAKVLGGITVSN